jgi:hypothetical protein
MDVKQLRDLADKLFKDKVPLNTLWQEISDHFYPERADFTLWRSSGTDFAANLMSSYPVLCRRDLGNALGTMLRPTAKPWFHVKRRYEDKEDGDKDSEVNGWLQYMEKVQRRAMYDRDALFTKAAKVGDHDFAAFGQCCISVEMNRNNDGLLYRCWHLRDMAWQENQDGKIGFVVRKWKPTAQQLFQTFGSRVHEKVMKKLQKTPFEEIDWIYHIVCEAEMYDKSTRCPRFSIWYDAANDHVMEDVGIWGRHYVIPRWQTVTSVVFGSQYSYSPATVAALPDARLIQAMTYTILEAGEKATSPPMIAVREAVRSDVAIYAGGITWVDADYDERMGEALRPLTQDFRGFNFGTEMVQDVRGLLSKAFHLDALTMPQRGPEMTAYEVGQRVQQYIRDALPIFEPMEMEYNAAICDETQDLLIRHGAFGDLGRIPRGLKGADLDFTFESPLHDVIEQQKGKTFQDAAQLIGMAVAMDPQAGMVPNSVEALRDALNGIGVPATWMYSPVEAKDRAAQLAQQQRAQQMLAAMQQGSEVVKNVGGIPGGAPAGGPAALAGAAQ